jgi:hypothetical protein
VATSPDHPELQFVEALKTDGKPMYTRGRPNGPPKWVVIHDMEANETPTTAEATANYFHTGAGGRSVSSHYCADNNSVVQCVLLQDSAWTVGNWQGNNLGINWELSGFAAQSREQWLDPFGVAMFDQIAPIIRSDAARYGIPLERRTIAELQAFIPGVTSHNDLGRAFGGSDHTDPGVNFPWDYLMALLTDEKADEMIIFAIDKTGAYGRAGQVYRCNGVTAIAVPDGEVRNQTYAYGGPYANGEVSKKAAAVGPWIDPPIQVTGAAIGVTSHLAVYDMGPYGEPPKATTVVITEAQIRAVVRAELNKTKLAELA